MAASSLGTEIYTMHSLLQVKNRLLALNFLVVRKNSAPCNWTGTSEMKSDGESLNAFWLLKSYTRSKESKGYSFRNSDCLIYES